MSHKVPDTPSLLLRRQTTQTRARLRQVVELDNVKSAREEDLELVHATEHITRMRQKAIDEAPCVVADFEEPPDNVTYMTKASYEDALKVKPVDLRLFIAESLRSFQQRCSTLAVQGIGVALALVDCVAAADRAGTTPKGFGLIRPPGHHATTNAPMGFCLFNNIAIAARHAQQRCGLNKARHRYHRDHGLQGIPLCVVLLRHACVCGPMQHVPSQGDARLVPAGADCGL